MRQELNTLIEKLHKLQGQRDLLKRQFAEAESNKVSFQNAYENTLKARAIVQNVASETQKQIEYHISNLVTMALASVFPDPYEFKLRFVQRRNKTEADLVFIKRGDNEVDDILENGGGGVADVASFALRIALWSVKKSRSTLILDEPFKFVSVNLQEKCSLMIKEISEKLKLQIIMVSHLPKIIYAANKIIEVKNMNGESVIVGTEIM